LANYAQTTTPSPEEGAEDLVKYPRDKVSILFRGKDEIMHLAGFEIHVAIITFVTIITYIKH